MTSINFPTDSAAILIAAIIAAIGPTVAVTVGAFLQQRNAQAATRGILEAAALTAKVATDAKLATEAAQKATAVAQASALGAAKALVVAAKITDSRLENLQKTATSTHVIVNSQRTAMLRLVADLRRQIATAQPDNAAAESAALQAEAEAEVAGIPSTPQGV
jgi:phenylpyruvate tautomerase PptA (4-oxalocrotonate tautomerase family)